MTEGVPNAQAYSLNQALQQTIEAIENDDDCKALASPLQGLSNVNFHMQNFAQIEQSQSEKIKLDQRLTYYNDILLDPEYSDLSSYIIQEIITTRTDMINYSQDEEFYQDISKTGKGQTIYQALDQVNLVLSALQSSPSCVSADRGGIAQLVGGTLQVASMFLAPGSALAVSAAGVLVNSFNSFYQNYMLNKTLNQIDRINLASALSCGAEAYVSQYCEMQDTKRLVDQRFHDPTLEDKEKLQGINLIDKHLDYNLKDFLSRVRSSATAVSDGNLFDLLRPEAQIFDLRSREARFDTNYVQQRENLLRQEGNEAQFRNLFGTVVQGLAWRMIPTCNGGNCGQDGPYPNPIQEKSPFSGRLLPYVLFNFKTEAVPNCVFGKETRQCPNFSTFLTNGEGKPDQITMNDFIRVATNAQRIFDDVLVALEKDFQQVNSLDPINDLNYKDVQVGTAYSAQDTLILIYQIADRVAEYLSELALIEQTTSIETIGLPLVSKYTTQANEVAETRDLTRTVLRLMNSMPDSINLELPQECENIVTNKETENANQETGRSVFKSNDRVMVEGSADQKAPIIVRCLVRILKQDQPSRGFYFNKVRSMVRYELEARRDQGEFDQDFIDIIAMSRMDILESLQLSYGEDISWFTIERQLDRAQFSLAKTYQSYFENFAKLIVRELKSGEVSEQNKQDLCFWSTGLDKNSKIFEDIAEQCSGMVIVGNYGDQNKMVWDDIINEKDFSERVCSYITFEERELILDAKNP